MARFTSDDVIQIAERLRQAKENDRRAHFLIGAGCSISANIPSASDLIKEIHRKYPAACAKLSETDRHRYGACMTVLSRNERNDLIRPHLDAAKINWGTIALAQLIADGLVGRVLTVNFDLVLENACALLGLQPAVYDFGVAPTSDPKKIVSPAIIHLHGQSYGLLRLNTQEETEQHQSRLKPILTDTLNNAPLLVIGYSGSADGIFKNLVYGFDGDNPLYWMGYAEKLGEHLNGFSGKEHFHFLGGADFDRFMIELANALGCWPPRLFADPLGHLLKTLEPVASYPVGSSATAIDLLGDLRRKIESLKRNLTQAEVREPQLRELYMKREFDAAAKLFSGRASPTSEDRDIAYWLFVEWGDLLCSQAENAQGAEQLRLYALAEEKYAQALKINPVGSEALYNWGTLYSDRAESAADEQAFNLFASARVKYEAALAIKPDDSDALKALGDTLFDLAGFAEREKASRLLASASEKYGLAFELNSRDADLLNAFGSVLLERAKDADDKEKAKLFASAEEKYAAALDIKPDNDEVLTNWGNLLSERASLVNSAQEAQLFAAAQAKYQKALTINPNNGEALVNWGNLLAEHGKYMGIPEAGKLFDEAEEKYSKAVQLDPENVEAFYNWGNLLSVRALRARGNELSRLAAAAVERYKEANRLKPDATDVLNNWADLLLELGRRETGEKASMRFAEAEEKLAVSVKYDPTDYVVLCSFGELLSERARRASGDEANELYGAAEEKYAASLKLEPQYSEALRHWGRLLVDRARRASGGEARRLLSAAEKRLKKAGEIDSSDTYDRACLAAVRGDEMRCREYLENAENHGTLPDQEVLLSDPLLEKMRSKRWFRALLNRPKHLKARTARQKRGG